MGSKKHKKQKSERGAAELEDGTGPAKPLKLVFKFGTGSNQDSVADEAISPVSVDEKRHKHKKKKKKKSNDRDRSRYLEDEVEVLPKRPRVEEDSGEEAEMEVSEVKPQLIDEPEQQKVFSDHDSDGNSSPSRKLREPRACTVKENDGAVLKQMLNYLLKNLQNKDVNGFFAFPVTDTIAPGYSSIILHPMDFSNMAAKIEAFEYRNVMEFKADFSLMCHNAMTYNRPDTIYFKEAKRLQQIGVRQLSKEKLLLLKKTHSFLSSITLQELGFDESGQVMEPTPPLTEDEATLRHREEIRLEEEAAKADIICHNDLAPEEILAQAQEAASKAKNLLSTRSPKTDLGFLRMEEDGTTTMTILNPWNDGVVSSKQRVISLGDYMGKLKSGSGSLFKYREDKRNRIDTETYLCYGPFSSHAPTYDSSFATCTKEESDLLLNTYGGEIGVQYAKSVQKFVENAGASAVEMVDKLLDTLTANQHSEARLIQERQKRRDEEMSQKALQDEMITKAQQAAEQAEAEAAQDKMQQKLNETAALLSELSQTQNERLSQKPPPHLAAITHPSQKEADLANQVTDSLVKMTKQVHPNDVVSTGAVRNALGITTLPVPKKPVESTSKGVTAQKSDQGSIAALGADDDSDDSEMEGHEDSENEPIGDSAGTRQEKMEDSAPDMDFNSGLGDL